MFGFLKKISKKMEEWILDPIASVSRKQLEKSVKNQVLFLLGFVGIIIFIFGTLFFILGLQHDSGNPYWFAIISLLGPDGLFELEGESLSIRILSFLLTIFGLIIFNGILIAIVVSNLQRYFEEIRRGSGVVRGKDHLLIFGWSSAIPTLLREIEIYSRTENIRSRVVLVTEQVRDSAVLLRNQFKGIEYSYRAGSALSPKDLQRLKVQAAKSILVFYDNPKSTSANNSREYDAKVIKSYLSILTHLGEKDPAILVNFSDIENANYIEQYKKHKTVYFDSYFYSAKFVSMLLKDEIHYEIFNEVLSFEKNDFHFQRRKDLAGKKFKEFFLQSMNSIVVGIYRNEKLILNPPPSEILESEDELIFLGKDSRALNLSPNPMREKFFEIFENEFPILQSKDIQIVSILGINPRLPHILEEFHKEKSTIYLYGYISKEELLSSLNNKISKDCLNRIIYKRLESESQEELQKEIFWKENQKFILLSEENSISYSPANHSVDEKTLLMLLKISKIQKNLKIKDLDIICEIKDPNSQLVVEKILGNKNRYVIGTSIAAKIMNMGLVHKGYVQLFYELLQKGNMDIGLCPYSEISSTACSFSELLQFAFLHRRMIALGIVPQNRLPILNPSFERILRPDDLVIFLYMSEVQL